MLSDLVSMSRSGKPIAAGFGNEVRTALQPDHRWRQGRRRGRGRQQPGSADFDGLDFKPVPVNFDDDASAADAMRSYAITFRPKAEMLKKANEPLYIIRELRKLGELELVAQTGEMPSLSEMEPDRPYIWWTGTLQTSSPRAKIDEVFEFVVGDCDLEIVETNAAPAAEIVEIADAPPTAPQEASAPLPPRAAPAMPVAAPAATAEHPEVASGGRSAAVKPGATTTRIELERIDRVVNMVGELVISQAMLGQIVQDLPEGTSGRLAQILEEVIHHTRELKDSVMSMRAQLVSSVFQRMPRLVRELSTKTEKKVAWKWQADH